MHQFWHLAFYDLEPILLPVAYLFYRCVCVLGGSESILSSYTQEVFRIRHQRAQELVTSIRPGCPALTGSFPGVRVMLPTPPFLQQIRNASGVEAMPSSFFYPSQSSRLHTWGNWSHTHGQQNTSLTLIHYSWHHLTLELLWEAWLLFPGWCISLCIQPFPVRDYWRAPAVSEGLWTVITL